MTLKELTTEELIKKFEKHTKSEDHWFYRTPVSSPHYSKHEKQNHEREAYEHRIWINCIQHELKSRGLIYDCHTKTFITSKD